MSEAHHSLFIVHPREDKMYHDMICPYWWAELKRDIAEFVSRCATCQLVKMDHQFPTSVLQPLEISMWKWESISMDFITRLPTSKRGQDSIWIIVDILTNVSHFLPVWIDYSSEKYARLFLAEIVKLRGVPLNIETGRGHLCLTFGEAFSRPWGQS